MTGDNEGGEKGIGDRRGKGLGLHPGELRERHIKHNTQKSVSFNPLTRVLEIHFSCTFFSCTYKIWLLEYDRYNCQA